MRWPTWLCLLVACKDEPPKPDSPEADADADSDTDSDTDSDSDTDAGPTDADLDGSFTPEDCDDSDAQVYPGAPERCGDGRVTDCDRADEAGLVTVDGDETFTELQPALDAQGAQVAVCAGTWAGPFVASAPVALVAHGEVTLQGSGAGPALAVPGGSEVVGFVLTQGQGGLLQTSSGTLLVSDCVVTGNEAEMGGGIALAADSAVTVTDTEITSNTARQGGGGLYAPSGASVDLAGSVVEGNTASYGGGVFLADASLQGGTVTGNVAAGPQLSDTLPSGGGGLAATGSVAVIGTELTANTASHGGGLSIVAGSLQAQEVLISDNLSLGSGMGAGAVVAGASLSFDETSLVSANTADGFGGGVAVSAGSLSGGTVSGNLASYGGGVVLLDGQLTDTLVLGNEATDEGGGVALYDFSSVTGAEIADNTAPLGGGVMSGSSLHATVVLTEVTLADNTAEQGAGLYHLFSPLELHSCVVLRNLASVQGGGAEVSSASSFRSFDTDWGTSADDNQPDDVFSDAGYSYDSVATFTCDLYGCE